MHPMAHLVQDRQLFQLFCQGIVASATVSDALIVSWRPSTWPSVLLAGKPSIGKSHPVFQETCYTTLETTLFLRTCVLLYPYDQAMGPNRAPSFQGHRKKYPKLVFSLLSMKNKLSKEKLIFSRYHSQVFFSNIL